MDIEDGVKVCLHALGIMEWVFSKSNEQPQTVRMVWEARKMRLSIGGANTIMLMQEMSAGDEFDLQHTSWYD